MFAIDAPSRTSVNPTSVHLSASSNVAATHSTPAPETNADTLQ
jgi:hypothetical protein